MAELQLFGDGTRLDPPLMVGGVAYGYAWRFRPAPSVNNEGTVVGTGIVQAVTSLGGGRWRITCKRDYQFSDYDKAIPGEGTINVVTQHLCGGNICHPREWMRAISHANPMATRGSLESERLVPGDGARFTRAGKTFLWEVTEAEAYAAEPAEVNYVGEVGTVPPSYLVVDVNEVAVTRETVVGDGVTSADRAIEGGAFFFEPGAAAPFDGSGLSIWNGSVYTSATREVFTNPETGGDDVYYLPDDFGAGLSGVRYWWDPWGLQARMLTDCATAGDEALLSWYVKNVPVVEDAPKASPVIVEAVSGAAGFAPGGDTLAVSGFTANNEFDVHFAVFQEGVVLWRVDTSDDCPAVWASVSAAGVVTVKKRDTVGGGFTTLGTSSALSFPFQVRIERAATVFNVYTRPTLYSGSWTLVGTGTPSGVPTLSTGLIGFGVESNRASAYSLDNVSDTVARTLHMVGDVEGLQHVYRFKQVAFVVSKEYPVGSSQPIARVLNVSTDEEMTESASERRDCYSMSGGNLVFRSETSGDEIRVEYDPFEEVPEGPGSPPRTFQQPNLATFAPDPNPDRLATTDVDENLINWPDVFEMEVELDGWEPVVGETFEIVKGAGVWGHDAELSIKFDTKGTATDFETLTEGTDLLVLRYRGIVLMTEAARLAHEGQAGCLLVDGARYVVESVTDAVNEWKGALESLEGLWINLGIPEGGGGGISGYAEISKGATTNSVRTYTEESVDFQTYWQDGACWGLSKEQIDAWWERDAPGPPPTYLNAAMPYWYGTFRRDLRRRSGPYPDLPIVNELTAPPTVVDGTYEVGPDDHVAGEYAIVVDGFGTDGPNRFGSLLYASLSSAATFSLAPVGFNIAKLARALEGMEVLAAKIRVKFTGLKYRTWTYELMSKLADNRPDADVLEAREKITVNGYVTSWTETGTGIDDTFTAPPSGYEWVTRGRVAFAAIAVRYNSVFITSREGTIYEEKAFEIISGGPSLVGGGTEVDDGEWAIVDCTDLVRFFIGLLDSEAGADAVWLVPSVGSAGVGGSAAAADGLGAYVDSLMPAMTATFEDGFPDYKRETYQASGNYAEFDTLEFGELMVRVRLGAGPATWMALPLVMPAMM